MEVRPKLPIFVCPQYLYFICQHIPQMINAFVLRWIPEDLQTAGCVGYKTIILIKADQNDQFVDFIIISCLVLVLSIILELKLHPNQVQWTPTTQDIWGPSLTSLQGMLVKVSFYKLPEIILKT